MSQIKNTAHHGEFFMIGGHCERTQFDQLIRNRNAIWVDETACQMDFMQIFVYAAEEKALKAKVVWDQWRIDLESVMRNDDPHRVDQEKIRVFFAPLNNSELNQFFFLKGPVIFGIEGRFISDFHIDHLVCDLSKNEIRAPSITVLENLSGNLDNISHSIKSSIKHLVIHHDNPLKRSEAIEITISGFDNLISIKAPHRPICLGILPKLQLIKVGRLCLTPLERLDLFVPELEVVDCDTITISSNDRSYGTINNQDFPSLREVRFSNVECPGDGEIALYRQTFNTKIRLIRRSSSSI